MVSEHLLYSGLAVYQEVHMSKNQDLTVYELERTLGIRAGVSKAPLAFRRCIEEYLESFCEVRIGDACALVPEPEELSGEVFMAIANPGEKLLASFRRTEEDYTYWSRRKKRTSAKALKGRNRNECDDEDNECDYGDSGQEEHSVLVALDSWRNDPEVKAVTRRRRPAETLFGFEGLFTPAPGPTWITNIRFVTFNRDWICVIQWRDSDDDLSEENITGILILGFANRRDLYRSIVLLLSAQPANWLLFISGQAEISRVGKKPPTANYLKAIEICCRRDGSGGRMGGDDIESSAWAEVLPLLTESEIRKVVPRIDLSDLRGSQAQWMCEHGADPEDVDYSAAALLATFPRGVNRELSYRRVVSKKRMPPLVSSCVPARKPAPRSNRPVPHWVRGR
jgi:hypothetical protein